MITWGDLKKWIKTEKVPDDAVIKVSVDFKGGPVRIARTYKDQKGKKVVAVVLES